MDHANRGRGDGRLGGRVGRQASPFAEATRGLAAQHPDVDFLLVHPGVVRTELGARPGLLGRVLSLVKRRWEAPEACPARLAQTLDQPRWSQPGTASWYVEDKPATWPI